MSRILVFLLLSAVLIPVLGAFAETRQGAEVKVATPEEREATPVPYTESELRLLAVQDAGRAEVAAAAERLATIEDPVQRRELQREIGEIKIAWRIRYLEEHILIADESGNEQKHSEAQDQLDQLRERISQRGVSLPTIDRPAGGGR